MGKAERITWAVVPAAVCLVVYGAWAARTAVSRDHLNRLSEVPPFRMAAVTTTSQGMMHKDELLGHIWIAGFLFTHCGGPCPILASNLATLQATLPKEVRLVTFTVDPDRDTLDALQRYAQALGADPNRWWFVRGEKGALYRLMYEGFNLPMVENPRAPSGFRVTHSTKLVLVDSLGVIRGYYRGDDPSSLQIIQKDVLTLVRKG